MDRAREGRSVVLVVMLLAGSVQGYYDYLCVTDTSSIPTESLVLSFGDTTLYSVDSDIKEIYRRKGDAYS